MTASYPVWDIPTRFIHWCFPIGIGLLWWTGETGRLMWHSYVGYALVVLVTTRIVWGFVGSFHSRFVNFVRGPASTLNYVKGMIGVADQTAVDRGIIGHNPLGAYSTAVLLSLLLLQGVSGMFSIDDIAFDGPLAYYFEGDYIDLASEWHDIGWIALQAIIALHLSAIAWYQFKKHQSLIQTMWFGSTTGRASPHRPANVVWALLIAVLTALILTLAINLAPEAPSYY